MSKNFIKEFLYTFIIITLGIIAIKFVIWLLPVIFIGICGYYVYKSIKKDKKKTTKQKQKKKPIKIIDMVEEND